MIRENCFKDYDEITKYLESDYVYEGQIVFVQDTGKTYVLENGVWVLVSMLTSQILESSKPTNSHCKNCGAPVNPNEEQCEYCGSWVS